MDIQEGCAEANLSTDEVKLTKNSSEEIYLCLLPSPTPGQGIVVFVERQDWGMEDLAYSCVSWPFELIVK